MSFLLHISFSMWKCHCHWRLPWRIAVYSLNAGYVPVGIYLCPFRCFLKWFVDSLASRIVLYIHTVYTHAYVNVWFSVSGFCQGKWDYSHTSLDMVLVIASTAGTAVASALPWYLISTEAQLEEQPDKFQPLPTPFQVLLFSGLHACSLPLKSPL